MFWMVSLGQRESTVAPTGCRTRHSRGAINDRVFDASHRSTSATARIEETVCRPRLSMYRRTVVDIMVPQNRLGWSAVAWAGNLLVAMALTTRTKYIMACHSFGRRSQFLAQSSLYIHSLSKLRWDIWSVARRLVILYTLTTRFFCLLSFSSPTSVHSFNGGFTHLKHSLLLLLTK